jgi:hypothetical protein
MRSISQDPASLRISAPNSAIGYILDSTGAICIMPIHLICTAQKSRYAGKYTAFRAALPMR